MTWVK